MTRFFKGKNKKAEVKSEPRKLEEIKSQYETLRNRLGDLDYQIYALKRDADQIKGVMVNLNYEAAARQEADKAEGYKEDKNEQV